VAAARSTGVRAASGHLAALDLLAQLPGLFFADRTVFNGLVEMLFRFCLSYLGELVLTHAELLSQGGVELRGVGSLTLTQRTPGFFQSCPGLLDADSAEPGSQPPGVFVEHFRLALCPEFFEALLDFSRTDSVELLGQVRGELCLLSLAVPAEHSAARGRHCGSGSAEGEHRCRYCDRSLHDFLPLNASRLHTG
jgi:hypothetical protein